MGKKIPRNELNIELHVSLIIPYSNRSRVIYEKLVVNEAGLNQRTTIPTGSNYTATREIRLIKA